MLADMVRTGSHQPRPVAGDTAGAEAVKVVTRTHKTLVWERTRAGQRLRHALREYFPAALEAFEDLDAADTLELLAKAPDPASAAKLSTARVSAALRRARRRDIPARTAAIQAVPRAGHLGQPAVVTAAHAASVRALVAVLGTLNEQVKIPRGQVEAHFGEHPDAEVILSQPGPTTTSNAPAARTTAPRCVNSPTDSSASCTDASKPAPPTTKRPLGRTTSAAA